MKCTLIFCIWFIAILCIKGENNTQPKNNIYSLSIITNNIFSKQFARNISDIYTKNETYLQPVYKMSSISTTDSYHTISDMVSNSSINITNTFETVSNNSKTMTISSETIEDLPNFENSSIYMNTSENILTNDTNDRNDTIDGIIPAMPGIPVFREPPEIKIHDPDEGPLNPYYHPSNQSDYYPTTSMPDQQFIFMRRPQFETEKGSLEEKYKHMLSDKNDDDITLPPGFNEENVSNYTTPGIMTTMSTTTTSLSMITTTLRQGNNAQNYFQTSFPYFGYPFNPYIYGFPSFVPNFNYRSPYIPPLYPGYYPNYGKQETELKKENSVKINEENVDPRYKMLPKSYATHGAHIEQVSVDEKASKDMTAGDSDSLEVYAPFELKQEKEEDKVMRNVTNQIINDYLKLSNKTIDSKPKIYDNRKSISNSYPKARNIGKRIRYKNQRVVENRNNKYPKSINRRLKVLVHHNRTNIKFPKFIDNKRKKIESNVMNYDFNQPFINSALFTTQSLAFIDLRTTENPLDMYTFETRNPALTQRYNNRRLISRRKHNKPIIKKNIKNNFSVNNRLKKKNIQNPKAIQLSSKRRKELIDNEFKNKIDWKQTIRPKFLLRAKLRNSNQLTEDKMSTNKWWALEQPTYCSDPIYVVNDCRNKKLTKSWSYDIFDQRCYFYEDFCAHVKRNSFVSSQECFQKCWRVKKREPINESENEFKLKSLSMC